MSPIMFFLLASFAVDARTLSETVPGTVVHHSPASSGVYIGSPGIILLPNGNLIAKCDEFGPKTTENQSGKTLVFRSSDKGNSWQQCAEVNDMFWATLFTHQNQLYLLGTHKQYGDVVICRSTDGGRTWTRARDKNTGRLKTDAQYHCAPTPVIEHRGRLWRAIERMGKPGVWGSFQAGVMSAPCNADLLCAESWSYTNFVSMPEKFAGRVWLEGNVVVAPDGTLWNILRSGYKEGEKAIRIRISPDGKEAVFDPNNALFDLPGASDKKFTIRFDPVSRCYWSVTNPMMPAHTLPEPGRVRNTLALISSPDLFNWQIRSILLYHPDTEKHAFQYPDWVFDGQDLLVLCRTAYDDAAGGAHNFHDANYLTFHRIRNFREIGEAHTRQVMAPWKKNPEKRNVPVPRDLPGVVIDHSPAISGIYLGSPAIAVLPNGDYIAKCDEFGPKSSQNSMAISRFYRSSDTGQTWEHISTVKGLFWASLFVHRNSVYAMGTDKAYGSVIIRKSTDGGKTWSKPNDKTSGLLLDDAKYHTAPVPVVEHNGRIWRAMEDAQGPGGWGSHFRAFMMSAPIDADLLRADSWTCSNRLGRNPAWLDSHFGGWLERLSGLSQEAGIILSGTVYLG